MGRNVLYSKCSHRPYICIDIIGSWCKTKETRDAFVWFRRDNIIADLRLDL